MDPAMGEDFSDRIKRVRRRLDLTQAQLAERLGVSLMSVSRWENRHAIPLPVFIQALGALERDATASVVRRQRTKGGLPRD
jgi:transcriptional regulator with XRE-family HTH domain